MWQAQVFTLYPEVFPGPLSKGLYGKALSKKLWNLNIVNIRDAAEDKYKTVDDTPYGGGSGMLLKPDVLAKSLDQNEIKGGRIIYLSPKGKKFDQNYAQELSDEKSISLICGHFEGVDERVLTTRNIEEISIGDYVLSGGELAAAVLTDSIVRLIPGALNNETSALTDSFQDNLLAPPVYTRPANYKGWEVPEILTSGNLKAIEEWRHEQSLIRTQQKRPNLLD